MRPRANTPRASAVSVASAAAADVALADTLDNLDGAGQLIRAGYDVPEIRYPNTIGALTWLAVARMMHRDPTGGAPVKIYDSLVVPVLRRLEGTWGAPFGQSVFAVATRRPSWRGSNPGQANAKCDGEGRELTAGLSSAGEQVTACWPPSPTAGVGL